MLICDMLVHLFVETLSLWSKPAQTLLMKRSSNCEHVSCSRNL